MKRFQVPGPSVLHTHTQSQRHFDIIQVLVGYTGIVNLQYEEYRRFKLFVHLPWVWYHCSSPSPSSRSMTMYGRLIPKITSLGSYSEPVTSCPGGVSLWKLVNDAEIELTSCTPRCPTERSTLVSIGACRLVHTDEQMGLLMAPAAK